MKKRDKREKRRKIDKYKRIRGKPNEPSFIIHTVNKLAQIKNLSNESVMKKTSDNFFRIFKIKPNDN